RTQRCLLKTNPQGRSCGSETVAWCRDEQSGGGLRRAEQWPDAAAATALHLLCICDDGGRDGGGWDYSLQRWL
ncbi:unnamed protein product, partial [Urochloa humidicola]